MHIRRALLHFTTRPTQDILRIMQRAAVKHKHYDARVCAILVNRAQTHLERSIASDSGGSIQKATALHHLKLILGYACTTV